MNNKIEKAVREHMRLPYTVVLRRDSDGDIIARIKELEGCVADGQDDIEALGHLHEAQELWLAAAFKAGIAVPKPETDDELPSGKWLQRVPRSLHGKLTELARFEGVSLNQLVLSVLAEAAGRRLDVRRPGVTPNVIRSLEANAYGPSRGLALVRRCKGETSSRSTAELSSQSLEFAVGQIPESERLKTLVGSASKSLADIDRRASGY